MDDDQSIDWVREHITNLQPWVFYRELGYTYQFRKDAENDLKRALEVISQERNRVTRVKASRYLKQFKKWIHSRNCEYYWLKSEKKMDKFIHDVAGRKAAYHSLNIYTKKVNAENEEELGTEESNSSSSSSSIVQTKLEGNPFEESSADDDEVYEEEYEGEIISIDEEREDTIVEVDDLGEMHVVGGSSKRPLTEAEWAAVRLAIDKYRSVLPKTRRLYDPLYYFLIDHSGHHGPTSKVLDSYFGSMLASLPDTLEFGLPKLSDEQDKYFDKLIEASDFETVAAMTHDELQAKDLVRKIMDSLRLNNRNDMSEFEHQMRNLVPFIDATFRQAQDHRVHYGEHMLHATVVRRNKDSNPAERERAGYKVDVLVKFTDLTWKPEIGCGEVSGGLPRCSRAKEWRDTLKLGWELRDMWIMAQNEFISVDTSGLAIWGFTLVGRKFRIYALAAAGGFFHLVLVCETLLPSSLRDMYNIKSTYCAMLGFLEKLEQTKTILCDLDRERARAVHAGSKRKMAPGLWSHPPVVSTPKIGRL